MFPAFGLLIEGGTGVALLLHPTFKFGAEAFFCIGKSRIIGKVADFVRIRIDFIKFFSGSMVELL